MNSRIRFCLVLFVFVVAVFSFAPVVNAQEQPNRPPSDVTPPQTPSDTPTGERDQLRSNQNGSNTPPTAVTAERYADTTFSWGTLILGLILGGIIGYIIGRQPRATRPTVSRDRAA